MTSTEPTPVTVLGGYLGAGKTTLMNRLLAEPGGRRIAVLVNDFGEVNVDAELLGAPADGIVELSGGCVCCDLSLGLGPALDTVRLLDPPIDHVVIEVSGVGEPASVAAWAATPGFSLDTVLVAVALDTARARIDDRWVADVVRRQLAQADLVLATKVDLTDDAAETDALAAVRSETSALIVVVPPDGPVTDLLVGTADHRGRHARATAADANAEDAHDSIGLARDRFVASTWAPDDPARVDPEAAAAELAADPAVLRAKGYLRDVRTGRRVLVQVVGARAEITSAGPWPADAVARLSVIRRTDTQQT